MISKTENTQYTFDKTHFFLQKPCVFLFANLLYSWKNIFFKLRQLQSKNGFGSERFLCPLFSNLLYLLQYFSSNCGNFNQKKRFWFGTFIVPFVFKFAVLRQKFSRFFKFKQIALVRLLQNTFFTLDAFLACVRRFSAQIGVLRTCFSLASKVVDKFCKKWYHFRVRDSRTVAWGNSRGKSEHHRARVQANGL